MKKLLIILLTAMLLCSIFTGCDDEQNTESSVENNTESLTESSAETSEPKIEIPEKVVYFTGEYYYRDYLEGRGEEFVENSKVTEAYSSGLYKDNDGLVNYLKNNEVEGDTYFLVGAFVAPGNDKYNWEGDKAFLSNYLSRFGFLEIKDHPMMFDMELFYEISDAENTEEHNAIVKKYYQKKLPGVDISKYLRDGKTNNILFCEFTNIGYISVDSLMAIAKDPELDMDIFFTWFPAPDDQERWLTME